MDPKLAELYGTSVENSADTEKLAAAELAEKLAGEEGLDLSEMSAEEVEQLANEVLQPPSEEPTEEEKVAEADHLGRIIAHSYVQELRSIEKEAAIPAAIAKIPGMFSRGVKAVGQGFKDIGYMAKSPRQAAGALKESLKAQGIKGTLKGNIPALAAAGTTLGGIGAGAYGAKKMFGKESAAKEDEYKRLAKGHGRVGAALGGLTGAAQGALMGGVRGLPGAIVGGLGGGAIGGGLGYAGGRLRHWAAGKVTPETTKQSSATPALDTLAEARATEILEQNEKMSALNSAVEERAIELLRESGFEIE